MKKTAFTLALLTAGLMASTQALACSDAYEYLPCNEYNSIENSSVESINFLSVKSGVAKTDRDDHGIAGIGIGKIISTSNNEFTLSADAFQIGESDQAFTATATVFPISFYDEFFVRAGGGVARIETSDGWENTATSRLGIMYAHGGGLGLDFDWTRFYGDEHIDAVTLGASFHY